VSLTCPQQVVRVGLMEFGERHDKRAALPNMRDILVTVYIQNGHKPKRPQAETATKRYTKTATFTWQMKSSLMTIFSARCNIYISRLCYDVSVRLSVTEVHWRRFRSNSDPNLQRIAVAVHAGAREGIIAGKSGGIISCYAIATARRSYC